MIKTKSSPLLVRWTAELASLKAARGKTNGTPAVSVPPPTVTPKNLFVRPSIRVQRTPGS